MYVVLYHDALYVWSGIAEILNLQISIFKYISFSNKVGTISIIYKLLVIIQNL